MIFKTNNHGGETRLPQLATPSEQVGPMSGKTVLVIGNEMTVLERVVLRLAEKGADIVLVCWQLSLSLQRELEAFAFAIDQRLLVIEQVNNTAHSLGQLVRHIIAKRGQFDVFIDLSTHKNGLQTADSPGATWKNAQRYIKKEQQHDNIRQ